jgi:hypothetical protein
VLVPSNTSKGLSWRIFRSGLRGQNVLSESSFDEEEVWNRIDGPNRIVIVKNGSKIQNE